MLYPVFLRRCSLTNHLSRYQSPFLELPSDAQWKQFHSLRILPCASTCISNSQPDPQGSQEDPQVFQGPRALEVDHFNSYLAVPQGHHKQVTSLAVPGSTVAETCHLFGVFLGGLFCSEWRQASRDMTTSPTICPWVFSWTPGLPVQPTLSSSLWSTAWMSLAQAWSWPFFQKSHKVCVRVTGFFFTSQLECHVLFPFS